jgi:hypothetical protein
MTMMRPSQDARFAYINQALRDRYEATLNEPLPKRWVDLIKALNERERALRELHAARSAPDVQAAVRRGRI